MVHRPRRRTLDDLPVPVVDRAVARALEATFVRIGLVATVGWSRHGWILRRPRYGASQVRALPVQRHEAFGHTRQIELAIAHLLDVADLEVGNGARDHRPAKCAQALRREKAQEPDTPLAEQ